MLGHSSELSPCCPSLWLFADEKQMFCSLSLSFFFFALSVLILFPWSTQKPHAAFSKFYKWWCFFHYHRGPVLRGRIWTSVTARGDEKHGYGQEKRLRKKGMTSRPRVSSIHSFHIQLASQTAFSDCRLWGLSQTQPSFCLRCHSALNVRSLLRRAGRGCLPFFLPLGMLKHPQNFLLKRKSRWRMTCRHELNSSFITFDETLRGAACWLDKSLHGVFCREWSLVVIVLNVGWLLSASYPAFTFP